MNLTIGGLDFETTGFVEPDHRIIETCLIQYHYNVKTGKHELISEWTQRNDPERSIPAASTNVHGIVAADLVGQPKWKPVAGMLSKLAGECDIVVAHNGLGFDFPFMIQEMDRVGIELPDFEPFDTMTEGRWATPFGESPSLQKLCFACGVDYNPEEAHAARYDVVKMMDCFFYGIEHGHFSMPEVE